jgi:hypothetical protein
MKNTEAAFKWIVGVLRSHEIPFQITGGLAARIYGAQRELADIDITIPEDRMSELAGLVREYSTFGPERYQDAQYDLMLMTLTYEGQEIDIDPETARIFDVATGQWITSTTDVSEATIKELYGLPVPVIPVHDLIAHKSKLGREVDLKDVQDLEELGFS